MVDKELYAERKILSWENETSVSMRLPGDRTMRANQSMRLTYGRLKALKNDPLLPGGNLQSCHSFVTFSVE